MQRSRARIKTDEQGPFDFGDLQTALSSQDGNDEAAWFRLTQQNAPAALEGAASDLDGHPFLQVRMRRIGQGASDDGPQRIDFILRDPFRSASAPHDLEDSEYVEYGVSVLPGKLSEAVAGKQRLFDLLLAVFPLA